MKALGALTNSQISLDSLNYFRFSPKNFQRTESFALVCLRPVVSVETLEQVSIGNFNCNENLFVFWNPISILRISNRKKCDSSGRKKTLHVLDRVWQTISQCSLVGTHLRGTLISSPFVSQAHWARKCLIPHSVADTWSFASIAG